jgi:predicted amidohydrolase
MNSELLQQVRVLDPISGTDQLADVLLADGFIKAVELTYLIGQPILQCEIVGD